MKKVKFPQDELAHNLAIEWWYWNGHLRDKSGKRYSYMDCLFRAKPKKVKLPLIKEIPAETIFFSHSLVTDIRKKKFYPKMDYFNLVSKNSFTKPLLYVNYMDPITIGSYLNNVMQKIKKDHYYIKTKDLELYLHSQKKPLLENKSGYLRLPNSRSTYYYSLTSLKTIGKIRINNKWIKVTGKSWMDHQWSNVHYVKDKWTWFSIQLDNKTEIVCFEYGNNKKYKLASISYPDNKQKHSRDIIITPIGKPWKSTKTKAEYPLEWKIEIPEFNILLTAKVLVKQQEMLFGILNYWEGPIDIRGKIGDKKITGVGFSELVGYPSEMSNIKFIKKTFKKAVNMGVTYIKRKL